MRRGTYVRIPMNSTRRILHGDPDEFNAAHIAALAEEATPLAKFRIRPPREPGVSPWEHIPGRKF